MSDSVAREARLIALGGNPNVGKSTIFNSLTGLKQHTGNWPGKTVSGARGEYRYLRRAYTLVDLPGTYSLAARSAEEEVARDFLMSGNADAVVIVCDATCLERSLRLVYQAMEITPRVIVCVNLLDEARKKGIVLDLTALERVLGLPVTGVSARSGEGLEGLTELIRKLTENEIAPAPIHASAACGTQYAETGDPQDQIARTLVAAAEKAAQAAMLTPPCHSACERERRADALLTGRFTGIPLMLLLLCGLFWLTLTGANAPSRALSAVLFRGQDVLYDWMGQLHAAGWLRDVLVLGVYRTLAWVVSVMLPPMAIFFPLFTILEDFGYLPRVAFTLDRCFCRAKACGKQALTMCMVSITLLYAPAYGDMLAIHLYGGNQTADEQTPCL